MSSLQWLYTRLVHALHIVERVNDLFAISARASLLRYAASFVSLRLAEISAQRYALFADDDYSMCVTTRCNSCVDECHREGIDSTAM